ncbi:unnamed protein product [Zymoseptoria tritici ST99CH_3D7]|uniref:ADP-ribose 1''-phosphate phosphatase n=1 Tax=Zymoseptoria tritici (strain ST99CH_3D7) TaxID=1276538 RepID=A0A1X7S308_ZYMT9|nr:unnamed protein product [Zymoseptoria tritici ST99CH_3D7]
MSSSLGNGGANTSRKRSALDSLDSNTSNSHPFKRPRATPDTSSKTKSKSENISKYFKNPRAQRTSTTSSASPTKPKHNANPHAMSLSHHTGDIFSASSGTLILHACNCEGSWGGGIALAFRKHYPQAFKIYADHCAKFKGRMGELVGTSLLISPATKGVEAKKGHWIGCLFTSGFKGKKKDSPKKILESTETSVKDLVVQVQKLEGGSAGWAEDVPGDYEDEATQQDGSEEDGSDQSAKDDASRTNGDTAGEAEDNGDGSGKSSESPITTVRMCKINSGLFNVEWERTVEVLEGIDIPDGHPMKKIEIWERKE